MGLGGAALHDDPRRPRGGGAQGRVVEAARPHPPGVGPRARASSRAEPQRLLQPPRAAQEERRDRSLEARGPRPGPASRDPVRRLRRQFRHRGPRAHGARAGRAAGPQPEDHGGPHLRFRAGRAAAALHRIRPPHLAAVGPLRPDRICRGRPPARRQHGLRRPQRRGARRGRGHRFAARPRPPSGRRGGRRGRRRTGDRRLDVGGDDLHRLRGMDEPCARRRAVPAGGKPRSGSGSLQRLPLPRGGRMDRGLGRRAGRMGVALRGDRPAGACHRSPVLERGRAQGARGRPRPHRRGVVPGPGSLGRRRGAAGGRGARLSKRFERGPESRPTLGGARGVPRIRAPGGRGEGAFPGPLAVVPEAERHRPPRPCLGEHTGEVLRDVLGLEADEIADLHDREVVESMASGAPAG